MAETGELMSDVEPDARYADDRALPVIPLEKRIIGYAISCG